MCMKVYDWYSVVVVPGEGRDGALIHDIHQTSPHPPLLNHTLPFSWYCACTLSTAQSTQIWYDQHMWNSQGKRYLFIWWLSLGNAQIDMGLFALGPKLGFPWFIPHHEPHCTKIIRTPNLDSKGRFKGSYPCVRPWLCVYENLCKNSNINCISEGIEIKKEMRERRVEFYDFFFWLC